MLWKVSLCALLDGHHKAAAAALLGRKVETLVILPATATWEGDRTRNKKGGLSILDFKLEEEEVLTSIHEARGFSGYATMTKAEAQRYLTMRNAAFDGFEWPEEFLQCERSFPGIWAAVRIEEAGDLSDLRLERIRMGCESIDDTGALNIITALFFAKHRSFKQMAFYFCRNRAYIQVWFRIYQMLASFRDEETEDFFVEYLIDDDKRYPEITRLIDAYLTE